MITDKRQAAAEAYEVRQGEINELLRDLTGLLHERRADALAEGVDWSHVGDLAHVAELLEQARAFLADDE